MKSGYLKEDVLHFIKSRRSIRDYETRPIPVADLEKIIDCGRLAPSARNRQPWEFVVVTDKSTLIKMADICTYGKHLSKAAASVVVCGKADEKYLVEDCCAATENILLAAHVLGIGSCWIAGRGKEYCAKIKALLRIPQTIEIIAIVALGYPAGKAIMPRKRNLSDVMHFEQFGLKSAASIIK